NCVHGGRSHGGRRPARPAQLPPPPSSRRGLAREFGRRGGACLACAGGVAAPFMGAFSVVATPSFRFRDRPARFVGLVHEDTGNHVVPGARVTTSAGGGVTRAPTHSPPLPVAGDSAADSTSSGSPPRR